MKVPNLQRKTKNSSGWSGEKLDDEHNKRKLPWFTSQFNNPSWMICWVIVAAAMDKKMIS